MRVRSQPNCFIGGFNMIGYLILLVLQIIAAWFGAPFIQQHIPVGGDMQIFVHAAIFAVIVWLAGVIASFALKDVRMPQTSTLALSLVLALAGAGITLVPQAVNAIHQVIDFPPLYLPLAGAVLGYMIRR